jgi:hypothetical protein
MTVPYGSPQTLKKIYAARPEQSATPSHLAEQYVGKVAGDVAKGEAEREVRGGEVAFREKSLATKADIFNKKLSTEQEQFNVTDEIKDQAFELQKQMSDYEQDLAKKATWFAGIKTALNIGGAWWADKQSQKLMEHVVGSIDKLDAFMSTYSQLAKSIVGDYNTGAAKITPMTEGSTEDRKLLRKASGE